MAFFREPFPEDIDTRIQKDFPANSVQEVTSLLQQVRAAGDVEGIPWCQLGCLRMANGNLQQLSIWIEQANRDRRDLQLSIESVYGPDWERDYILYAERREKERKPIN
jgi:hypothetical protein